MTSIRHELSIDAPIAEVYEAISSAERIGSWWDKQTTSQTDFGLVLEHNPGPEHGVVQLRVVELVPNERIEWECISTHPKSSPASAWTGTRFLFRLSRPPDGGVTTLDFQQLGYDDRSEFIESNRAGWRQVLENLKRVVESGHG